MLMSVVACWSFYTPALAAVVVRSRARFPRGRPVTRPRLPSLLTITEKDEGHALDSLCGRRVGSCRMRARRGQEGHRRLGRGRRSLLRARALLAGRQATGRGGPEAGEG